jgi:hypothetical protein
LVFPDFVLLDTQIKEFPMEVYGMNTEPYLKRKFEKEKYYTDIYGIRGHWMWDAAHGESIPFFPPKFS